MKTFMARARDFLHQDYASGVLLMVATLLAMGIANSPLHDWYDALLGVDVVVRIGTLGIDKPLLLWINDGLMAVFFLLVGLEIKREVLIGQLSQPATVVLPAVAAVGGMVVPAAIYAWINWGDPVAMRGWAIPTATDIAFALGVLSLLGNRVPRSLTLFLLTLAIVDDLGAIIIIALFYTESLSVGSLAVAGAAVAVLFLMNRAGERSFTPYILVGLVLWAAVLKSGVHATLAGVVLALFIPLRSGDGERSLLERLEHDLHSSVYFVILPLFAFANTGVSLGGMVPSDLLEPVPLGIAAGLFIGKQVGVLGFSRIAVALRLGTLPAGATWGQLYGVAILAGIGFTMSLFISSLAFEQGGLGPVANDRLGILIGSLCSAVVGYLVLRGLPGRHKS